MMEDAAVVRRPYRIASITLLAPAVAAAPKHPWRVALNAYEPGALRLVTRR